MDTSLQGLGLSRSCQFYCILQNDDATNGSCSKMQFSQTAFVVTTALGEEEEAGDEVVFFKKLTTIEFQSKAPPPPLLFLNLRSPFIVNWGQFD